MCSLSPAIRYTNYLEEFSCLAFLILFFLDLIQQLGLFFSFKLLISLHTDQLLALFFKLPKERKYQRHLYVLRKRQRRQPINTNFWISLLLRKPYTRMFAILYQMRKETIAGRNEETKIRKIKERHEGTKARRHEGTKARRHERTKEWSSKRTSREQKEERMNNRGDTRKKGWEELKVIPLTFPVQLF